MAARRTVKQELDQVVEFCREHFPHGAPPHATELGLASVSCEHGTYPVDAKVPAAETPAKDPEGEQEHDGDEGDEEHEQA